MAITKFFGKKFRLLSDQKVSGILNSAFGEGQVKGWNTNDE